MYKYLFIYYNKTGIYKKTIHNSPDLKRSFLQHEKGNSKFLSIYELDDLAYHKYLLEDYYSDNNLYTTLLLS